MNYCLHLFSRGYIIALTKSGNCMVLSWKNGNTGEFYPRRECGTEDKPVWIYYAKARGANLTVDINDGDYIFMLILIEQQEQGSGANCRYH